MSYSVKSWDPQMKEWLVWWTSSDREIATNNARKRSNENPGVLFRVENNYNGKALRTFMDSNEVPEDTKPTAPIGKYVRMIYHHWVDDFKETCTYAYEVHAKRFCRSLSHSDSMGYILHGEERIHSFKGKSWITLGSLDSGIGWIREKKDRKANAIFVSSRDGYQIMPHADWPKAFGNLDRRHPQISDLHYKVRSTYNEFNEMLNALTMHDIQRQALSELQTALAIWLADWEDKDGGA